MIFLYSQALLNEARAYFALQEHWGKYVPALVSHGTTGKGNVMYLASEFIKGSELGMGKSQFKLTSNC